MKPAARPTSIEPFAAVPAPHNQALPVAQQSVPTALSPRLVSSEPLANVGDLVGDPVPAAYRAMSFAIARQSFALPLSAISKVIQLPQKVNPFQSQDPFIIYRKEPLHLLNLYPLLAKVGTGNQMPSRGLVYCDMAVLVWLNPHQLSAVLVDAIPQVIELSPAAIYPLPLVGQPAFSALAEYVAVISTDNSMSPILLLNLEKAQSAVTQR
ncbi:MAG: chemotaxis protein CheW [Synechococcales bacterium]|nr:chemotaxis protein CheW [Synechococcales bacterium]